MRKLFYLLLIFAQFAIAQTVSFQMTLNTSDDNTADTDLYFMIFNDADGAGPLQPTLFVETGTVANDADVTLTGDQLRINNVAISYDVEYNFTVYSIDSDNVYKLIGAITQTFTNQANAPPTLSNFRVEDANKDRIYFDSSEPITASTVTGFSLGTNSGITITGISINTGQNTGHYFTLSGAFDFWDFAITIRYEGQNSLPWITGNTASDLQDLGSNSLEDFTLTRVVNNIVEPTPTSERYVNATATGGGDGLSDGTAWTFAEAITNATAGMKVWLKAGDYGVEHHTFSGFGGTAANPIWFEGYVTTPGDITDNYYINNDGVTFDVTEMPTFTNTVNAANLINGENYVIKDAGTSDFTTVGAANNNYKTEFTATGSTSGTGVVYSRESNSGRPIYFGGTEYFILRNFQVRGIVDAINALPAGVENNNIWFHRVNGHDAANAIIAFETLSGGVGVGSENIKISDAMYTDFDLSAVSMTGDGSVLYENLHTRNRLSGRKPDYQIILSGDNNVADNITMRIFSQSTGASTHGLGVRSYSRGSSNYNLMQNFEGYNINEVGYVRNVGCDYNVLRDFEGYVFDGISSDNIATGLLWAWGGSWYNVFEDFYGEGMRVGIGFKDNNEDGDSGSRANNAANDNVFRNGIVKNSLYGVWMEGQNGNVADLRDNIIANVVFDNSTETFANTTRWFVHLDADVYNLQLINCHIDNFQQYYRSDLPYTEPTAAEISYTNTNILNFPTIPAGSTQSNVTAFNPLFTDVANDDYTLQATSQLIGAGAVLPYVVYDYLRANHRGATNDIGPHQNN